MPPSKKSKKKCKINPNRRKEIIKVGVEINEIES